METITGDIILGVRVNDINVLMIERDETELMVRLRFNGVVILERNFWEFTSKAIPDAISGKLPPFSNRREFIYSLVEYIESTGRHSRRVNVVYKESRYVYE